MVTVTETVLDEAAGLYEQRYPLNVLRSVIENMVRRPVAIEPPEGTVCLVDNGPRNIFDVRRQTAGYWHEGRWKRITLKNFIPTHWTTWEKDGEAAASGHPR